MAIKETVIKKDTIVNYILDYIKENNLKKGDKLPSQARIVVETKISRTTVREAVKELEGKHILDVINGSGMFVHDVNAPAKPYVMKFENEKQNLVEVLETRWALETQILRTVIRRATEEELLSIKEVMDRLMDMHNKGIIHNKVDKEFHYKIYEVCSNKVLKELIISLKEYTDDLWDYPLGQDDPFTSTIPLHQKMCNSMMERDFVSAKFYSDSIFMQEIEEIKKFEGEIL